MKEHKEKVDSIRSGPSSTKNTTDDCFQVGNSSRVTRSQRRKHIEVKRARKESRMHPPNMGAHNIASTHATGSGLLKKRERTELEDGGFGILPLTNIQHNRNFETQSNTVKGEESSGQQREHEATKMELLNTIMEKMASIKRRKKEAEDDIHHGMTNFENKDKFISLRCEMDSLFHSSTTSDKKTPNTTKKTGLVNECTDIVLRQQVDDPLAELWDSPTYVGKVCESMRVSIENSKAMKFLNVIEPPSFDLGISPAKDVQTDQATVVDGSGSGVTKDKGKGKLFDDNQAPQEAVFNRGDIKKVIAPKKEENDSIDDNPGMTNNHPPVDDMKRARPLRRIVKLGDPLKSPYVVRIVDFNVSTEDKRGHEWALSIFGGKVDTVFRANDCVHIFRTGLGTLAATNMSVSPSVIAGWASILNYEEHFRNRDSIRRYFFSIEMMTAMKKKIDRFTSMDPNIKSHILRQAHESRFEWLEF
ncbi:hypothetical protein L6452_18153 [Arctium lappa]|uniref:Uncharacterized protein n=1 Tax=Arctium lappa TaxID=4217 RepID=A0ACB9C5I9_ARCLA|nr:hypothetical protein L6452_18153 [Arctium lappa]